MLSSYRSVLAVPGAARLFGSALLARFPQGMTGLGVLLLVRASTHSYAAAGGAVGAEAFAAAATAPLMGRLVDRHGRRRVLLPCACGYGGMLAGLVLAAHLGTGAGALVGLSALAGALMPPVAPVVRALLGEVFGEVTVRERAYALESVAQELIWITGPLIVGVLVAISSPAAALLATAGVGVLGSLMFVRAPLAHDRRAGRPVRPRGGALRSAALRAMLGPVALNGLALGSTEVGLPALALHAGSRTAAGLLLALWSLGSLIGGLLYGARSWSVPLRARYSVLLWLAVLCTAPLIAARSLAAGLVCSLLAGATIAPVFSCQYALVGRAVSPGVETEAFTWVSAVLVAGIAIGSAAGGAIVSAGIGMPFVLACGATALAAGAALLGWITSLRRPVERAERLA